MLLLPPLNKAMSILHLELEATLITNQPHLPKGDDCRAGKDQEAVGKTKEMGEEVVAGGQLGKLSC